MRINEYKRVLDGVDDKDLEQLQITRLETGLVLEYPENPPANWSRCTGSVKKTADEKSTDSISSDPAMSRNQESRRRPPDRGGMARDKKVPGDLPPCRFLDGFVQDMNEAFGEKITRDCISAHYPEQGKPLNARQVKQIIDSAERKLVELGIADRRYREECRENNDKIIAGFMKDKFWAGLLFREPDEDMAYLMRNQGRHLLEINAAVLVRKLTIALCQSEPEYLQGRLTETMLEKAGNNVLAIHDYICLHPDSIPLARSTAWVLIDQAFEKKGLAHVVKLWPVYMACAIAFGQLSQTDRDSIIRSLALEVSQNHVWSSTFLASVAPFYRDSFVRDVDKIPWADRSPDMDWSNLFDLALSFSRTRVKGMLITHHNLMFALRQEKGLSEWQMRLIGTELEKAPCTEDYFSNLVGLTESSGLFLADLAKSREPLCVFNFVGSLLTDVAHRVSSFAEHKSLLRASLTVAVAGLSLPRARSLLQHVRSFHPNTQNMIASQDIAEIDLAYRTLLAVLEQRSGQAGSEFQMTFVDLLRSDQVRAMARLPPSGYGAVSHKFVALILNSVIVLNARNGQPLVDLDTLHRCRDDKSQIEYVESVLFQTLALTPDRVDHQKYLTLLTNTLYLMQNAILRTCSETIFKNDHSGMLYLSDNTLLQKLDDDLDTIVEVTLIGIVDRNIHFNYSSRFSSIRSAIDHNGRNRWLEPDHSEFTIEAEILLAPSGVIGFAMPLSCKSNLVLGQWPESCPYPQPVVRDLVGEVIVSGVPMATNIPMRRDLYAFAADHKYVHAMTAMEVLEAIRIFIEAPVDEEMDCAIQIYERFIKTRVLDFLGKSGILGDILQELYPRMDPSGVIMALRTFTQYVLNLSAQEGSSPPESRYAIGALRDLCRSAPAASIAENRRQFELLLESLTTHGSPLSRYVDRIPVEDVRELVERLGQFATPLDLFVFSALESALTELLGRDLLPLFVQEVVSRSSGSSRKK